jgi:ribonuclease HII
VRRTGQKLLKFDRKLGARFIAGTDEAGRGSLAGPLVVAGVLLDYACLREHRVRPLTYLNDSKQVAPDQRDELYRAVVGCADRVVVRVISADEIDRNGLHRSNLDAMRAILHTLTPPAEACLVDGFRLGATAPEHSAIVDGDTKSAAIAAASIVAKVTRDRLMRRMDAL